MNGSSVRLDSIAMIASGNSAPQHESSFDVEGVPFIRTSDVGKIHLGVISNSADHLTLESAKRFRRFPPGTILIPKSGASTFSNHRVFTDFESTISSHLAGVVANSKLVHPKYLYHFLTGIDARDLVQDQGYPSLSLKQLGAIELKLPSIEAQQAIAKRLDVFLDKVTGLRRLSVDRKTEIEILLKQVSKDLIAKLGVINYEKLSDLASLITKGTTPTSKARSSEAADVSFLKVESIGDYGNFIHEKISYIGHSTNDSLKRSQLQERDVLLSIAGALGRSAIVTRDVLPANLNQAIAILRLPRDSKVRPEFLFALFQSGFFWREFGSFAAGAAQQNLSLGQLATLEVPILADTEQIRFISEVETITNARLNSEKILGNTNVNSRNFQINILNWK